MSPRTLPMTNALVEYIRAVGMRESPAARRLREVTERLPEAHMHTAPEQCQLLALLVGLMGVRRAVEIGVFTGYSALWVAEALPADGILVALDVSVAWTEIAKTHWRLAGVEDKVDLHLGPARDSLDALVAGGAGTFGFVYIDADKESYDDYYESALALLHPNGLVALDNMLWRGDVADPTVSDPSTDAIRRLNAKIHADPRVSPCLVPVGDGLMLARKLD